ncbi:MAG: hypothetical protein ABSB86_13375, partial [Bryobacteraceae bacterium]
MISKIFSVVLAAGLLAFALSGLPTWAATTAFTLNISGAGSNGAVYDYVGSGTTSPFGNVSFSNAGSLTQLAAHTGSASGSFNFTFASGDSFHAAYAGLIVSNTTGVGSQTNGTATISGGSGQFSNASGSISFTLATAPAGNQTSTFSLTGSGSITTASAASSVITVGPPALPFSFVQGSTATA